MVFSRRWIDLDWWTNCFYAGFSAWTDSSSDPSSNYWYNTPGSIGYVQSTTIPTGHYVMPSSTYYFINQYGAGGAGYSVTTQGANGDYGYTFLSYDHYHDAMTVPTDGKITVSGYFMKNDLFYQSGLQQGRSYLKLFVLDVFGNIIASQIVMDYTYNNNQWYHITYTFTGLIPDNTVEIGFGRDNNWQYDWQLLAAGANILVTPG